MGGDTNGKANTFYPALPYRETAGRLIRTTALGLSTAGVPQNYIHQSLAAGSNTLPTLAGTGTKTLGAALIEGMKQAQGITKNS